MRLFNTSDGYGTSTKRLHWLNTALFVIQFTAASIMLSIDTTRTALGLSQATYYNWHKSMGLVALIAAEFREVARKAGQLSAWASSLSMGERHFIHRAEQRLYLAMFVMPISGYVYVAGTYGLLLFGTIELPNAIGGSSALAVTSRWTHLVCSYVLILALAGHIGLILRHQILPRDGLLHRMLPRSKS